MRRTGRGRVVFVGGEAGIGKTALLRCLAEKVEPRARVLWGGCEPLFTPRPLGAVADIAESAGGDLAEAVGRDVMPHEVVAALARHLEANPGSIVVLEDMHWADEATLDVLRLLGRRIDAVPALVVATYRDDELPRTHPLRIVVGELAAG